MTKNTRRLFLVSAASLLILQPLSAGASSDRDLYASATPDRVVDSDLALGRTYDSHLAQDPGAGALTGDAFGGGGYVHPFLSVAEANTDNVYNTQTGEVSDWYTVISPGIWFALPGSREQLLEMDTSNTSPGGMIFSRDQNEAFQRYQAYLLYQADILRYSDESELDTEHQRADGLLQFNLKSGITLDVVDQYKKASDPLGTTDLPLLDEYTSNLVDSMLNIDFSKKFSLAAGAGVYSLDYDEARNDYRDREDTIYKAKMSFHSSPKTALFMQYKFIDVKYDLASATNRDNEMQYAYAGVKWDVTAKSAGKLSAGYISRDFSAATRNDVDEFGYELQLVHEFTPKTSLQMVADRKISETTVDDSNIDYILSHNVSATYLQDFTSKFSGNLFLAYVDDKYEGAGASTNVGRKDKMYIVSPSLDYKITEWMLTGVTYSYSERDSNRDGSDFKNNSYLVRLTLFI